MSATASDEYFHAIEETFIRLRGAPLLLSPADWQTARDWHQQGIPVELVGRVLEDVFTRLRQRDPERRIHSLRYCAPAVEEAWREVLDLGGIEGASKPQPIDVGGRLAALRARLPADLPRRQDLETRLGELNGDAEFVEAALEELETEYLAAASVELTPETRRRLDLRLERALGGTRSRVRAAELAELEHRLFRDFVRQELGLPPLSLFVDLSAVLEDRQD